MKSSFRLLAQIAGCLTICIITTVFIVHMGGCGYGLENDIIKPDDEISKSVYNAVGTDELLYMGARKTNNCLEYGYAFRNLPLKEEVLEEVIQAVNRTIEEEGMNEAVLVHFCVVMEEGRNIQCAVVSNCPKDSRYLDDFQGGMLDTVLIQEIEGLYVERDDFFYDIEMYKGIKGIKHLEITQWINMVSEKRGIDWYEWWPELEDVTVME